MRFEDLKLEPQLLAAVRELGYEIPTPIQQQAIPAALEGKDVMGRAPTGTGKTAAFMLPTLQRLRGKEGTRALVLCPTRELAIQVSESAKDYARAGELFVGVVYGGVPLEKDMRGLRAGYEVLVATPGRLIDHLERGNVDLSGIEVLVLDEADRMLDMGFRPQIDQILRRVPKLRQTLFFSATMPNAVKSLAYDILRDPVTVEAAPKVTTAEGVDQYVYPVEPRQKTALLLHVLQQPEVETALVFSRTKFGADRLAGELKRAGLQVEVMHSDRSMSERVRALESFRERHVKILIATDVAQRGIDVEGISHVINFDAPKDPEGYVHRVGRTARAGEKGVAITFMSGAEIGDVAAVEYLLGTRIPRVNVPGFSVFAEPAGAVDEDGAPVQSTVTLPPDKKEVRATRGRRMGTRAGKELTPEELEKLLKVG
ncbi:MAG TPA: DEAD/DEAH box helicase [Longimicrobiaceae bacterium]|nr:DEAD/DEAH box helicase [Longimicrobiaceae bacterium]